MVKDKSQEQQVYTAAGVMSGTSVDGLDMALCRFSVSSGRWKYDIIKTAAVPYDSGWGRRLEGAMELGGLELMMLHRDFGRFTGEMLNEFLEDAREKPGIVASHGHTVFHQPEKGLTLQIGDGAEIAAITGIATVSDFRRLDVALGGQGAPLVPIGDELLFGQYTYCLNLGGFANVSFRESGKRAAFDLCPANIVLNRLARDLGHEYDDGGRLAQTGSVVESLLNALESLGYYRMEGPRSLGREWVEKEFMPVLEKFDVPAADKLRTVCEHIALRIASVAGAADGPGNGLPQGKSTNMPPRAGNNAVAPSRQPLLPPPSGSQKKRRSILITGGGAKNDFLAGLISRMAPHADTFIPDETLVDFKEAIIFALLGVLRIRNQVNCLSSVTGARHDNSGGTVFKSPGRV